MTGLSFSARLAAARLLIASGPHDVSEGTADQFAAAGREVLPLSQSVAAGGTEATGQSSATGATPNLLLQAVAAVWAHRGNTVARWRPTPAHGWKGQPDGTRIARSAGPAGLSDWPRQLARLVLPLRPLAFPRPAARASRPARHTDRVAPSSSLHTRCRHEAAAPRDCPRPASG